MNEHESNSQSVSANHRVHSANLRRNLAISTRAIEKELHTKSWLLKNQHTIIPGYNKDDGGISRFVTAAGSEEIFSGRLMDKVDAFYTTVTKDLKESVNRKPDTEYRYRQPLKENRTKTSLQTYRSRKTKTMSSKRNEWEKQRTNLYILASAIRNLLFSFNLVFSSCALFALIAITMLCSIRYQLDDIEHFSFESLYEHNYYRAMFGVPDLELDPELVQMALVRAQEVRDNKTIVLVQDWNGESIYIHQQSKPMVRFKPRAGDMINALYAGVEQYDQTAHQCRTVGQFQQDRNCLRFTQMVWKGTRKVGCAYTLRSDAWNYGLYYAVCKYYPAGNTDGNFRRNVPAINKGQL